MSEHYDFHYQPTGSGAISGQQVLEQTEDAINELGDYVYDNVGGAMDVAQEALETAQNAEQDAQTALDTANSFSDAIQSAQQDASTALSTAQTAQTTATNANATAIQASQDANSAVTTANNASGQVSTLSGTVTALGQRVTTAEGNIGQNTSDITALTTRVGTAEGNITTLQNDVSIAQGNASSAMATAGQVKQQAYVFRYSSTALVASSTNSNALLDNTDNLKVGDKVIDSSGVLFSITAIDTANSTFTIGTALIDLANDADVVHKSGDETVAGIKSFSDDTFIKSLNFTNEVASPSSSSSAIMPLVTTVTYTDQTASKSARVNLGITASGDKSLYPHENNQYALGLSSRKWSEVHGVTYYYGSSDTEFSQKFVTTDTAQTISGSKTFGSDLSISNTDTTVNTPSLRFRNYKVARSSTVETGGQILAFLDKSGLSLGSVESRVLSDGGTALRLYSFNKDSNNQTIGSSIDLRKYSDGSVYLMPDLDNDIWLGNTLKKWKDVNTYLVNGLTPSSLSMPVAPSSTSYVDISSYITVVDSSTPNTYTPPSNGYITFSVMGNLVQIFHDDGLQGKWSVQAGNANRGFIPVLGGVEVKIYLTASSIDKFWFIPCQGNI